ESAAAGGPRTSGGAVMPTVTIGPDRTVPLGAVVQLSATVVDNAAGPPAVLGWAQYSTTNYPYPDYYPPGTVTFSNTSTAFPTATFSAAGTYLLQARVTDKLSSDDGTRLYAYDAQYVTVLPTAALLVGSIAVTPIS